MHALTNGQIRSELGQRVRRRRLDRNMTQARLAELAGINRKVVSGFERGREVSFDSFLSILRVLDLLDGLDELVPAEVYGPSPITELTSKSRRPVRQRARGRPAAATDRPWRWGDEPAQPTASPTETTLAQSPLIDGPIDSARS